MSENALVSPERNTTAERNTAAEQHIYLQHLPADSALAPALILIHGWGASSAVWQDCIVDLQVHFNIYLLDLPGHGENADLDFNAPSAFVDAFARQHLSDLPARFALLGWSLGGVIASLLARRCSDSVSALVTVATNRSFVAKGEWRDAMAKETFATFAAPFNAGATQPDIKQGLDRFYHIQSSGCKASRAHLRDIRRLLADTRFEAHGLEQGLQWLRDIDLQDCWHDLAMPVLHQFGQHDALVPVDAATRIAKESGARSVEVFQQASHAPFISDYAGWLASTKAFLLANTEQAGIDKTAIAKSFSDAAKVYDSVAKFQQQVGRKLLKYLPKQSANRLIDLGAGTGFFSSAIHQHYPGADLIELDISDHMLAQSRERRSHSKASDGLTLQVQADFEALPVRSNSIDILYSNLSLQWCHRPEQLFADLFRSVTAGGSVIFTTLLDGSLYELKQAWSSVDAAVHVNPFDQPERLKEAIEQSGFVIGRWDINDEVQGFDTLAELIRSVKDIGAHNMNANRPKGLMGKNRFRRFTDAYEAQRPTQGQLPLTYRVLYAVLSKPAGER